MAFVTKVLETAEISVSNRSLIIIRDRNFRSLNARVVVVCKLAQTLYV